MRPLVLAVVALALAACAGAPKKAPPAAAVAAGEQQPAPRRKSPYAPAQEDPGKRGDYVAGGLYAPHVRDSVPDELPDVDAIPEPEVTNEPPSRVGNRASYTVLGKRYNVLASARGYVETGTASYYGQKFHGRRTSNLEVYDMYAFSAAHKTLPLPSFARVTNLDNGKSVIVRVNDRGPFHEGRLIDLSYAAAAKLGYVSKGTARVEVRALMPGDAPVYAGKGNEPAPPKAVGRGSAQAPSAIDRLVAAIPAKAPDPVDSARRAEARFDMRPDGRAMSAAEFDTWMQSRRSGADGANAPVPAPPAASATPPAETPRTGRVTSSAQPADNTHSPSAGRRVTLQVASFAARANADRALSVLLRAGIQAAHLFDGDANGQRVWRLRVGPLPEVTAPELATRIAGLGFGPPQRVAD